MDWDTPKRRLLRIAGKNELPDQPPTDVLQKGAAEPPKKDAPASAPTQGMPVPPPRVAEGARATGEKKGFFEKLFGEAEKIQKPKPAEPPRSGPVDEEVEELFEQMQGDENEQAAAGAKPAGKRRGKKGKEKPGEGKPKAGKEAEPEPLPVPTEGMTYRERRKLDRMRTQRQAEGPAAAGAQPPEPVAGQAEPGAQPSPVEARQTRRQQRLAQRQTQDEQQAAQPQGGAAQEAPPVSSELSGLDVGDLMSTGKKKKKKAAADELEELDEAGLGEDEELSEEELDGEGEEELDEELKGGEEELLTKKCQHCKRQAKDTAFCPACGAAMCDQCAPERAKLLDQVKWTCRQCRAQFKVKAKKGVGDEF